MRRANALYYHDLSGDSDFIDLCSAMNCSRTNDTEENHKLFVKYVYNHLRKTFETENAIQLTYTEDMSKVFLVVYDCLASELDGPVECVVTETERYIEF